MNLIDNHPCYYCRFLLKLTNNPQEHRRGRKKKSKCWKTNQAKLVCLSTDRTCCYLLTIARWVHLIAPTHLSIKATIVKRIRITNRRWREHCNKNRRCKIDTWSKSFQPKTLPPSRRGICDLVPGNRPQQTSLSHSSPLDLDWASVKGTNLVKSAISGSAFNYFNLLWSDYPI